jgi:hypothetical protein
LNSRLRILLFFIVVLLWSCGAYPDQYSVDNIVANQVLPGRAEQSPYFEVRFRLTKLKSCEWTASIEGAPKTLDRLEDAYLLRLDEYREDEVVFIYCLNRPNRKTKLILPPLSRPIIRQ